VARAEPAPGEIVAEVSSSRPGVREITLLGQNVNSWGRDLAPAIGRSSASCCERATRSRDRADPVHEPASEGLPRSGDRRDGRVRERVRARAPARTVRLVEPPEGDAANIRPRALPASRRAPALRDTGPRPRNRSHRGLPGRDGGGLPGDALARRGGAVRLRVHVHLLAPVRDGGSVAPRSRCSTR
jgi:hypothetical protein